LENHGTEQAGVGLTLGAIIDQHDGLTEFSFFSSNSKEVEEQ
jgi:hypothetical protein